MILARPDVLKALETGDIGIDPFDPKLLGAASVDLRLSPYFRRLIKTDEPLELRTECDYRSPKISTVEVIEEGQTLELQSNETVLGLTVERIRLSGRVCARLEGRSRFARLGLLIHISAGYMAPGTDNQQVLEISNMSARPLLLRPGTAICQMIFERMSAEAVHKGRYSRQTANDFLANPED